MTTSRSRVVLIDDHELVRAGLRQAIERDARFEIAGEAGDGETGLSLLERQRPQIAVLDISMPKKDGFAVARAVRERQLAIWLVFLTLHDDEAMLDRALELGARGYLLKANAMAEIVDGLGAVAEGKHYVSRELTGYLIGRRAAAAPGLVSPLESLTPAERRVLSLVADYRSNQEIADQLFVHRRTVESHRASICQKLDLRGHNALLRFALEHKPAL